jgi:nicotinamidase-related amidase
MKLASKNIFEKSKGNALTSEDFANFIKKNEISEFFITGADAIACVKSTVFNMCKEKYKVTVISDCITSYDKRKIDEMLNYYEKNGSRIINLYDLLDSK